MGELGKVCSMVFGYYLHSVDIHFFFFQSIKVMEFF